MRKSVFAAMCVLVVVAATSSGAQQGYVPPRTGIKSIEPWRPTEPATDTRVIGAVIDLRRVPVAFARVQLRDLLSGRIDQESQTDPGGEYSFTVASPGTFVVEMLDLNGNIVAVSNAGTVARYETLQTLVQLPGRWDASSGRVVVPPSVAAFFGASGAQTMTSTTLEMAIDQNITPADPGEPVSPHR